MVDLYTYGAKPAQRNLTVADLRRGKGVRKFTQVTAVTEEEASAAEIAGIDTLVCDAPDFDAVRRGAPKTFLTTAIPAPAHATSDAILSAALAVMSAGSDAIYSCRAIPILRALAAEGFPLMSHIGMNPRKSTWYGGLRVLGKTAAEARSLLDDARRLEDAGVFAVEAELIAEEVLYEISRRTSLVTFSLGSGDGGDVIFLYTDDICGESSRLPRHARSYDDFLSTRRQLQERRIAALKAFSSDVTGGTFPTMQHSRRMAADQLERWRAELTPVSEHERR